MVCYGFLFLFNPGGAWLARAAPSSSSAVPGGGSSSRSLGGREWGGEETGGVRTVKGVMQCFPFSLNQIVIVYKVVL